MDEASALPRNIWMYWHLGLDKAPKLARYCLASWKRQNPDWDVHFLSEETLGDYLDKDMADKILSLKLPLAKTANLIRLALLLEKGGVWADVDCYCPKPLDSWIHDAARTGFFAFRFEDSERLLKPEIPKWRKWTDRSNDRIMSNWFLAGHPGNPLIAKLLAEHIKLLSLRDFRRKTLVRAVFGKPLFALMRRNSYLASFLSRPEVLRLTQGLPYFVFHYHFARLVMSDAEFRKTWDAVEPHSANRALTYSPSLHEPVDQAFLSDMNGGGPGAFKLHSRLVSDGNLDSESRYDWIANQ